MRGTPLLRAAAVAAAVGGAAAFRGSPLHQLVEVRGVTLEAMRPVSAFEREDFEEIHHDRVKIWATKQHLADLRRAGLDFGPTEDIGAASFAEEKRANYTDTKGREPDWSQYCGYNCLTERLAEMAATGGCAFPFELQSIGKSNDGRDVWVAHVGNTGPEVLMAANVHGDETTGGQILQRWLWSTCNSATTQQAEVARSVNGWYMLMFNPDGYERNRRGNSNNADLNRAFPTPTSSGSLQTESRLYMDFSNGRNFDRGLMMHGGAVVCCYSYENCYNNNIVPRPCPPANTNLHPRHSELIPSSRAYCDNMNQRCTVGSNCQINGAAWYPLSGSSMDWNFHFNNVLEITMEVSSTKRPSGSQMPSFYNNNVAAIHAYMIAAAKKDANSTRR